MKSSKYLIKTLMKCLLILTIGLSISFGIFFLYHLKIESVFGDLRLASVSSISIEGTPVKGEGCTVTLNGAQGACCRLEYHKKEIYEQDKLINITLWESCYSKAMCLQYVKRFQYNISIIFPSFGNWTIRCNKISINIIVGD